jgi:hypothetical protein
MWRFALTVTAIELALTAGAVLWISAVEAVDAYLTERDLEQLRIPYESLSPSTRRHGEALTLETRGRLLEPEQSLYVSVRTQVSEQDFAFRRSREEALQQRPDRGRLSLTHEPLPGEAGYSVRHEGVASLRFETVRFRGSEMVVILVGRSTPYGAHPSQEMLRCERRARQIQDRLLYRLGWRSE